MKYANKLFSITDLIKHIGNFKHQFEKAYDIEKLNNHPHFQHLLFHIFYYKCDTGITLRKDNERMVINIFHNHPYIVLTMETFEKYKKLPYYFDATFFNSNNKAIDNQRALSCRILNDNMLLEFFK